MLFVGFVLTVFDIVKTTDVRSVFTAGGLEWTTGGRIDLANDLLGLVFIAVGVMWFWKRAALRTEKWLFGIAAVATVASIPLAIQTFYFPKPGVLSEVYANAAGWIRIAGVLAATLGVFNVLSATHRRAAYFAALAPVALGALVVLPILVLAQFIEGEPFNRQLSTIKIWMCCVVVVPTWLLWRATRLLRQPPTLDSRSPRLGRLGTAGASALTLLAVAGPVYAISSGPSDRVREFSLCGGADNNYFHPPMGSESSLERQRERLAKDPDDGVARVAIYANHRVRGLNRRKHARWIIEHCPHSAALSGSLSAERRKEAGTKEAWEQLIERYPNDGRIFLNAGAMNRYVHPRLSVEWLERARALGVNDFMLPLHLSTAYEEAARKHPEQRLELAQRFISFARAQLKVDPSSSVAVAALEQASLVGNDNETRFFGEVLAERKGEDAHHGHTMLGLLAADTDDIEVAETHLQSAAAAAHEASLSHPRHELAARLLELGRLEAVEEYVSSLPDSESEVLEVLGRRSKQSAAESAIAPADGGSATKP